MWNFVKNKAKQRWLWYAIEHETGKILAYTFGKRKDYVFLKLRKLLEPFKVEMNYTDNWISYSKYIDKNKYPIKVNENIAICLFKESFLKILIEGNNQIRKKKLIKLQLLIECYTLPIRNLKCSDRRSRVTNKYKNNQKNSF